MNNHEPFEHRITLAVLGGRLDDETRAHLGACRECREFGRVIRFMNLLSTETAEAPDPHVVWLKAQLLRTRHRTEQVASTLTRIQQWVWALVGVAWAIAVGAKWDVISGWMEDFDLSTVVISSATGSGLSLSYLLFVGALMSITLMLAIHQMFAEE